MLFTKYENRSTTHSGFLPFLANLKAAPESGAAFCIDSN